MDDGSAWNEINARRLPTKIALTANTGWTLQNAFHSKDQTGWVQLYGGAQRINGSGPGSGLLPFQSPPGAYCPGGTGEMFAIVQNGTGVPGAPIVPATAYMDSNGSLRIDQAADNHSFQWGDVGYYAATI